MLVSCPLSLIQTQPYQVIQQVRVDVGRGGGRRLGQLLEDTVAHRLEHQLQAAPVEQGTEVDTETCECFSSPCSGGATVSSKE